jgi:hypothetical protein
VSSGAASRGRGESSGAACARGWRVAGAVSSGARGCSDGGLEGQRRSDDVCEGGDGGLDGDHGFL